MAFNPWANHPNTTFKTMSCPWASLNPSLLITPSCAAPSPPSVKGGRESGGAPPTKKEFSGPPRGGGAAKLTSPNPYTACLTEHAEHRAPGPQSGTIKGLHEMQALQPAPPWLVRSMHLHNQQLGLSQGPPERSECP